jgi:putative transposase
LKESNAMTKTTLTRATPVTPRLEEAWQAVDACFGRFCLTAGIEALQGMMAADVDDLCGDRHARSAERRGHRWGRTRGKIGYHGGKVDIVRPRVRGRGGDELMLPSWMAAANEDWLGRTAMNLMLVGVATRKVGSRRAPCKAFGFLWC